MTGVARALGVLRKVVLRRAVFAVSLALAGCQLPPRLLSVEERRSIDRENVEYPANFILQRFIGNLTAPTAMAFDNDLPQAARYIRQGSEQIQGVADKLRERDVRELVGDVQEFARQQPTLFFGGAVVLGFAALRFLKSAPAKQSSSFDARREE